MNQTIEDLEDHRESKIAHLETIENFIRDENRLIAILLQAETALAGGLELDEEEVA